MVAAREVSKLPTSFTAQHAVRAAACAARRCSTDVIGMAVARAVGLPLLLACAAAFAPAAIPRRGLRVSAIAAEDVAADEAEQLRAETARLREEVASMEAEVERLREQVASTSKEMETRNPNLPNDWATPLEMATRRTTRQRAGGGAASDWDAWWRVISLRKGRSSIEVLVLSAFFFSMHQQRKARRIPVALPSI